jgi:site-specific DNA-cytosine methylase
MKVLSLFNGMNTGRQALENVGIKVDKYYSSEIKPYAIELTQHHFPDTIQVGDVTKWREWDIDWKSIDLVLSGSPCQDLSAAGKRAGINGKKSSLFFVFIEILEHIKELNPNVLFLQENVGSASKLDVGIMSRALGVYPVRINSSLVTAQLRDRYYWSNIRTKETMFDVVTDIPQPKDKKIMLQDIITSGFVDVEKSSCVMEGWSRPNNENEYYKIYKRHKKQFLTGVYFDKSFDYKKGFRILNEIEMCRLQGFNDDYTEILSRNDSASLLGDGWTLPIIEHIFSFIKK